MKIQDKYTKVLLRFVRGAAFGILTPFGSRINGNDKNISIFKRPKRSFATTLQKIFQDKFDKIDCKL